MANQQPQKTSILAVLSLIFALLFFPLILLFLPITGALLFIIFILIGLILGVIALSDIRKNPSLKGKGFAIAGIVIPIIFILVLILVLIFYYGVFNTTPQIKEYCEFPMGLYCLDYFITEGTPGWIGLRLENIMGEGIIIREINITSSTKKTKCYLDLTKELPGGHKTYNNLDGWYIPHGDTDTVKIICDITPSEKKKVMDIFIRYCKDNATSNIECEKSSNIIQGRLLMH